MNMAFRLKPHKSPADEIVRVARKQIEAAAAEAGGTGPPANERIHEARTHCKKIRALLRLIRPANEKFYRRQNARFRDSARPLSILRDAKVMQESLERLLQQNQLSADQHNFSAVHRRLQAHHDKLLPAAEAMERHLARFARQVRRETDSFKRLEGIGLKDIAKGLALTYRRGRRAMRQACGEGAAEHFHEWRKQVKYLRYQIRLLRRAWPPVMKKLEEQAGVLSDLLGEEHDLDMLSRFLQAGDGEAAPALLFELIERRRRIIRAETLAIGERLFAEKPAAFVRRVAQWWQTACGQARSSKKIRG